MTLQLIEGGAGTGKSTLLLERLQDVLGTKPLADHQRVLALTKMHGSRRRMHDRLAFVPGLHRRFESVTIDGFALRLISRWRSLARTLVGEWPNEFDAQCDLAGRLLDEACVQAWVAATLPIVLIDELQDSKGGQLRVLRGLSVQCTCIAAGDPFQELDGHLTCASVEWARAQCVPIVLEEIHRTTNPGLLAAADALRNGRAVTASAGFGLKGVDGWGLGAWEVAAKIAKWKSRGTVAVITPVGPGRSSFVNQIVERVGREPALGKKWKVGPFKLDWEMVPDEQIRGVCSELGVPEGDDVRIRADQLKLGGEGVIRRVGMWLARLRRLKGRTEFTAAELRAAVSEIVQAGRNFSTRDERRLTALTIHQAKNREFDRVVILWPFEVSGDAARKRRLAYNAVTRAKHEAFIVVQSESRVTQVPFVSANGP
ncbi:MAG: ATP-dependent helicase [Archangium sp.]